MGWLKELAAANIAILLLTFPFFHLLKSWLKDPQPKNILSILLALETSQSLMYSLNSSCRASSTSMAKVMVLVTTVDSHLCRGGSFVNKTQQTQYNPHPVQCSGEGFGVATKHDVGEWEKDTLKRYRCDAVRDVAAMAKFRTALRCPMGAEDPPIILVWTVVALCSADVVARQL